MMEEEKKQLQKKNNIFIFCREFILIVVLHQCAFSFYPFKCPINVHCSRCSFLSFGNNFISNLFFFLHIYFIFVLFCVTTYPDKANLFWLFFPSCFLFCLLLYSSPQKLNNRSTPPRLDPTIHGYIPVYSHSDFKSKADSNNSNNNDKNQRNHNSQP